MDKILGFNIEDEKLYLKENQKRRGLLLIDLERRLEEAFKNDKSHCKKMSEN